MTIFWRIFLGFWIAMVLCLAIIFSQERWPWHRHGGAESTSARSALALAHAVDSYEQSGPSVFLNQFQQSSGLRGGVFLFGADGRVLAPAERTGSTWSSLATQAAATHVPVIARAGVRVAIATPVDSSSGRHYVVVVATVRPLHSRFHRLRFWAKLALAMVPATFICLGLALYITRPLSSLRSTARRLASGDLSARPPEAQRRRRDEIGELTRDVDLMAGRIEELLAAQRRFVADVAHELGAPLTRMQLALTLQRRRFEAPSPDNLDQIEREADRLSLLVQELLFLASLERGAIPAEAFVPVSLPALCGEIVQDNAAEVEEKACTITSEFDEVHIRAAPQALRRAVENVFRNAVRHAPPGSTVHLSCRKHPAGAHATITVRDTGAGVPQEMLSTIFQPFVRAFGRGETPDGTGLGLAIAAEAVTLHGGRIWASNASGGGLLVTIELPAQASA